MQIPQSLPPPLSLSPQGGAAAISGGSDGGWALPIGALVLGLRHIGLSGYGAQVRLNCSLFVACIALHMVWFILSGNAGLKHDSYVGYAPWRWSCGTLG